jgi:hypothetical protein
MAVADVLSGSLPEFAHRAQLRRAVIASTVGTTIEWYDFLLYSSVTGLRACTHKFVNRSSASDAKRIRDSEP